MKPETKEKLDKIVPLLAHWMEGGKFKMRASRNICEPVYLGDNLGDLVHSPEAYVIHVEPRVVYIPIYTGSGDCDHHHAYSTEARAISHLGLNCKNICKFVEDMNWKPHDATQQACPTPNQT